ncbi:MAG: biopolymer transporter ExbD [candidate division KSB1 bacterium]|nr:biopolymer transporter ExbD [candidate division KSB1 bacterium]MDZ7303283.1 biopolymer transporter ExbD [candidate division KSB1 bacterium]MDZ7312587.1 biopolymer transporter ExbD [candidate division KSB1 bacterium]
MQFRETSQSLSGSYGRSRRRIFINITSLIDVIFMLLIFFAVSSTFLEQPGMKLELPSAQSADIAQIKSYILYLAEDGSMRLNEKPVTLADLPKTLETALPQMAEQSLTLFADKNVRHGDVVKVMDIARQVGVKKLVIATTPEEKE